MKRAKGDMVSTLFPPKEIKTQRFNIVMTPTERYKVEQMSNKLGFSQSEVVRRACEFMYEHLITVSDK